MILSQKFQLFPYFPFPKSLFYILFQSKTNISLRIIFLFHVTEICLFNKTKDFYKSQSLEWTVRDTFYIVPIWILCLYKLFDY